MNHYLHVHEKLKIIREFKSIRAETLALQLNMSTSAYYKRENGQKVLDITEFMRLCKALNITPSTVLTNTTNQEEFITLITYDSLAKNASKVGEMDECYF